jgi:hypothetical protein
MERETVDSDFRPWRYRGGGRLEGRRRESFTLAAPVFRRHAFRGATIMAAVMTPYLATVRRSRAAGMGRAVDSKMQADAFEDGRLDGSG